MKRFKLLLYAQQFFTECMPIYPFYAIMFTERGALTPPQISLLFGIWTLVALLSEIPTGVLADRFSRRTILACGDALQALAFITWILVPNFWGYGLGFVLWGIGYAMGSGAFEAYLYDELKGRGEEKQYSRIYGQAESMLFAGAAAAFIGAIFIGATNYVTLLLISAGISLLSVGLIMLLPKEQKTLPHPEGTNRPEYLKIALREVRHSKVIARIVISAGLIAGIIATVEEYEPLYYVNIGLENAAVPVLMLVGVVLSAILSWTAHRMQHTPVYIRLLFVGIAGATLLIGSFQNIAFAVFGMLMFMRFGYLAALLFESSLQSHITSKSRATIASLPSFLAEIVAIILFGLYGIVTYFGDDSVAIRVLAAVSVISALLLFVYWGKFRKKG